MPFTLPDYLIGGTTGAGGTELATWVSVTVVVPAGATFEGFKCSNNAPTKPESRDTKVWYVCPSFGLAQTMSSVIREKKKVKNPRTKTALSSRQFMPITFTS
jgi:hypothetical protein